MKNAPEKEVMEFEDGQKAVITYDAETKRYRGEFVGLYGVSDFFAKDRESLKTEGEISLRAYKLYGATNCYG